MCIFAVSSHCNTVLLITPIIYSGDIISNLFPERLDSTINILTFYTFGGWLRLRG